MSMTNPQVRPSEAALIKSVCNREREAFYELVRPYERMIYATAISVVKNPADAEAVEIPRRIVPTSPFTPACTSPFASWLNLMLRLENENK
jgi:hypothetical protein